MGCLGFHNASEVFMFLTSLLVGVTMVMGVNAVNSAPEFMLKYYTYIGDSNIKAKVPTFWSNILNFYTIVTIVAQSIHEPTNITPVMCRFSLLFRLEASCLFMMVEILVILLTPFCGTSEVGAIVGMMIVAYLGGMARAYFENTGYALFSPCPSIMLSAMLIGSALSGAIVSVMQIVLKISMPDTHDSVLTQSILYFSFTLGVIFIAGVLLALLSFNSFAKQFIAEFRSRRSFWLNIYHRVHRSNTDDIYCKQNALDRDEAANDIRNPQDSTNCANPCANEDAWCEGPASDNHMHDPDSQGREHNELSEVSSTAFASRQFVSEGRANTTNGVMTVGEDTKNQSLSVNEQADVNTSELLLHVKIWPVIKKTYPMMLSSFLCFGVTYLIYPGLFIAVDPNEDWYTTLVMACFNFCDLIGRALSMWKRVWPSRRFILFGTILRIVFVPLLLLCATHIIPGKGAAYAFTSLIGLSNGFFGTLSMVYTPMSPGLKSDGEQAIAGQISGACLLFGCSVGSLVQLAEVILFN